MELRDWINTRMKFTKKQYDQIHRIRELILKKEQNIITHKCSDNSKEKMQTCSNKKSTQLTKKPYKKRESINIW